MPRPSGSCYGSNRPLPANCCRSGDRSERLLHAVSGHRNLDIGRPDSSDCRHWLHCLQACLEPLEANAHRAQPLEDRPASGECAIVYSGRLRAYGLDGQSEPPLTQASPVDATRNWHEADKALGQTAIGAQERVTVLVQRQILVKRRGRFDGVGSVPGPAQVLALVDWATALPQISFRRTQAPIHRRTARGQAMDVPRNVHLRQLGLGRNRASVRYSRVRSRRYPAPSCSASPTPR